MAIKLTCSKKQQEYLRTIAANRHEAKHIGIKNSGILTPQSRKTKLNDFLYHFTHKPHYIGVAGEFAYSVITCQDIDEKIYDIRDTGFDVGRAEIKTSTWGGEDIELKIKKTEYELKHPDKYVLMYLNENSFETIYCIGEISREDFDKYKVEKQYGPKNPINYVVGKKHLSPTKPSNIFLDYQARLA